MAFGRKKKQKKEVSVEDAFLDAEAPAESRSKNKTTLIFVLVLNVLMAGGWAYLKFSERPTVERRQRSAARRIVQLKKDAVQLIAAVQTIQRQKLESVTDPGTLIDKAADELGVLKFVRTNSPGTPRQFRLNPNFMEQTTEVSNLNQSGYKFYDIIRLCERIESKNPKVKIQSVKFGLRDRGQGKADDDNWRPAGAFIRVRTFAPKDSPQS